MNIGAKAEEGYSYPTSTFKGNFILHGKNRSKSWKGMDFSFGVHSTE